MCNKNRLLVNNYFLGNRELGDFMSYIVDTNWRGKYASLKEYYDATYDSEYYKFDKFELEIDPMETIEDIENYSVEKQELEMYKCALSFPYFSHKYVKITHPIHGLLPFVLYNYQRRVIEEYADYRFNIISKFRQGGLTTVTVNWCLWRSLFKLDETMMVLSKSDREAIAAGEVAKRALEELPSWMVPQMDKNNDHQKIFSDTGCKLFFYTPEAARGRAITYLILDEAAFIPNMEKFWKAMYPTISTGGRCIAISTVNGVGNWYEETYHNAEKGDNFFHIIDLDYWEHPDYHDEKWVKQTKAQLGEKGWKQEVLRDFLGAGDSYIPPHIIEELRAKIKDIEPLRMLFPEWNNSAEARELKVEDEDLWERGALHVWKEPVDGREYIIGVDPAEGQGEEADNTCFQVIDQSTCEQVAEFYSNTCPPHSFAQILAMVGHTYNDACIVVESQSCGLTVLNKLQHDFHYGNIFHTVQGKKEQAGVKTTRSNRPLYLETLHTRLINKSMAIRSRRFVKELGTFVYNKQTKRAEAEKGHHDDAIMAMCLALHARDARARFVPVGYDVPEEEKEAFKIKIYEDIKAELTKDAPDNWFEEEDLNMNAIDKDEFAVPSHFKRKHNKLLKEFGW